LITSLLDSVRANAAAMASAGRFVRIQEERIPGYALSLPLEMARAPELDAATHFVDPARPGETLAYVVTLDAINFGSGYFPQLKKRLGMSGYFSVASSLKDRWPLSVAELRRLTEEDCAGIFGQALLDNTAIRELMGLFAKALNDLGEYLQKRFGGSFGEMVAAARGSAENLVGILAEMSFYQDVGFYKRAQLTAADLSIAGVASFDDLGRLTIFADNLVPHVLRMDGVLEYHAELLERIEREELIRAGSEEEREIRACAVHAVELIAAALRERRENVSAMQLDYVLWNRGQGPAYKARPRHRTRTVYY
jgi:hypothetical protein